MVVAEEVVGDIGNKSGNEMEENRRMNTTTRMLETYPQDLGKIDRQALSSCIEACDECAQACTACADACLSQQSVQELAKCIRNNLDCADICTTTSRVLSRHTGYDANLTRTVLEACATACKSCGDSCDHHGSRYEHCKVCAEVCRRCESACQQLLKSLD